MSMPAFRWAKAQISAHNDPKNDLAPPFTSAESFVLLMLGDHYNEEWSRAWPSQQTLARETGLSTKTVSRAVDGLRQFGMVETEEWVLNDGAVRLPYRYLLPRYRPKVKPAAAQPVLAFTYYDSPGAQWENTLRIPGSNLLIEDGDLAA